MEYNNDIFKKYFWICWYCLFNVVWLAAICLGTLAIALAYFVYRYGDLVKILHGLERKDILKYTGSQYSFKDPLIVTIPRVNSL